jgi:peptide deformylase
VAFEIRQFGDPVLRSKAAPDALFDDFLRRLTEGMLNTLQAGSARRQSDRPSQARFVVGMEGEEYVLVNPLIEETTPETMIDIETASPRYPASGSRPSGAKGSWSRAKTPRGGP